MAARDQFDSLVTKYIDAVERGDAETIAGLYAEDALLLVPRHPPINGRQAIQANYRESLGEGYKMTVSVQDFQERGDTIYATGTFKAEDGTGNWLEVLQRQSGGSLLIHRLGWNEI